MKIAALIFDKITVLDIVGPIEVLSWVPNSEIVWVGKEKGPIRAAPTGLAMTVEHTLDEVTSADILIIPGGPGVRLLLKDEKVLDWVRKIHATTKWTTTVCTGSLLLGAAGLLKGLDATTHWNSAQTLESFGAKYRDLLRRAGLTVQRFAEVYSQPIVLRPTRFLGYGGNSWDSGAIAS